jgi:hypothetical protein
VRARMNRRSFRSPEPPAPMHVPRPRASTLTG